MEKYKNKKEKEMNINIDQEKIKALIPSNFRFTKKEKIIMLIIIILMIIGIIITWINFVQIMKANAEYEFAYQQYQEAIQKEQEEAERKRREKLPNLTEVGKENIQHIYSSDTKRAFLTFDDGPSSNTNQILDILNQNGIKATFFVLGSNVEKKPDVVKRMYDDGHFIANHGYSHVYESIYQSPENVLAEYNQCNQAVRDAIGEQEYNSHLFRFPGGLVGGKYADIKNQANELLLQNDIVHVDWNALNGDAETTKPTVEYEMQRLQETIGNKQSVVILMHDAEAKKVTVEALPSMIEYLKEQGYTFVNFYEIIK